MFDVLVAHGQTASAVATAGSTTITNIFTALGTFITNNAELIITVVVFGGLVAYVMARTGVRVR